MESTAFKFIVEYAGTILSVLSAFAGSFVFIKVTTKEHSVKIDALTGRVVELERVKQVGLTLHERMLHLERDVAEVRKDISKLEEGQVTLVSAVTELTRSVDKLCGSMLNRPPKKDTKLKK